MEKKPLRKPNKQPLKKDLTNFSKSDLEKAIVEFKQKKEQNDTNYKT